MIAIPYDTVVFLVVALAMALAIFVFDTMTTITSGGRPPLTLYIELLPIPLGLAVLSWLVPI